MPRAFKNGLIFLFVALVIGVATIWLIRDGHQRLGKHTIVTDFTYTDAMGRTQRLSAMVNRQLVLHFWATWCIPCRSELPVLLDAAPKHPDTMFLLFSVDADAQTMRDFLSAYKTTAPNIIVVSDADRAIATRMRVTGFPESFVVNPGLTLRQHLIGSVNWRSYPF